MRREQLHRRKNVPNVSKTVPSSFPALPTIMPISKKPNGAKCVRFSDTIIHTVGLYPSRHLTPMGPKQFKRRSGLSYLNPPTDPKKPRKVVVKFPPGKAGGLRRHREPQAAMARYWLRTEEEEAAERAED